MTSPLQLLPPTVNNTHNQLHAQDQSSKGNKNNFKLKGKGSFFLKSSEIRKLFDSHIFPFLDRQDQLLFKQAFNFQWCQPKHENFQKNAKPKNLLDYPSPCILPSVENTRGKVLSKSGKMDLEKTQSRKNEQSFSLMDFFQPSNQRMSVEEKLRHKHAGPVPADWYLSGIEQFELGNFEKANQLFTQFMDAFKSYHRQIGEFRPIPDQILIYTARTEFKLNQISRANELVHQVSKKYIFSNEEGPACEELADLARIKFRSKKEMIASGILFELALERSAKVHKAIVNQIHLDYALLKISTNQPSLANKILITFCKNNAPINNAPYLLLTRAAFYFSICGNSSRAKFLVASLLKRFKYPEKNIALTFLQIQIEKTLAILAYERSQLFIAFQPPDYIFKFIHELDGLLEKIEQDLDPRAQELPSSSANNKIGQEIERVYESMPSQNDDMDLMEMARKIFFEGNYREANFFIPKILSLYENQEIPDEILTCFVIVKIACQEFGEADHFLDILLRDNLDDPILLACAGRVKFELKNFKSAEELLILAYSLYKNIIEIPVEMIYMLAMIKFTLKKTDEAADLMDLALSLKPISKLDPTVRPVLLSLAGKLKVHKKKFGDADAFFEEFQSLYPVRDDLLFYLFAGTAKYFRGDYEQACELFKIEIEIVDRRLPKLIDAMILDSRKKAKLQS